MSIVLWETSPDAGTGASALWERVHAAPWWPSSAERLVIHADGRHAAAVVRDTVAALLAALARWEPGLDVRVLDTGLGTDAAPSGAPRLAIARRHRVEVARLPAGAPVPDAWLQGFRLVRVVGVGPDEALGLYAALGSQASLLGMSRERDLDVIAAAHLLLGADVEVACGAVAHGRPESGTWWAASADALALEHAVAGACGVAAERLPALRHLAADHAARSTALGAGGGLGLRGHVAPAARMRLVRLGRALARGGRRIGEDVRVSAQNLYRAPAFARKRLAAVLRRAEGTS
jgi:hypothetical protein